jgi:hypothetical protein
MNVQISDEAGRLLNLSPQNILLFEAELTRVLNLPGNPLIPSKVGADCTIKVTDDPNNVMQYQILGGSVLLDVKTNLVRQFYFGLVILQWLETVPGHGSVPVLPIHFHH